MRLINSGNIITMLNTIASDMVANRSYLIELDSAVGDGDLGLTMDKGFRAAANFANANQCLEPGLLLMKSGMEIVKVAPSTMGTLMGTGFMRGGKAITGKSELSATDLTLFFEGFLNGVLDRGKAKQGEKTIVDILVPVVAAMKAYSGVDVVEVLDCAVAGTAIGIQNEIGMMSQHGKAAVFREKTMNLKDPGSEAIVIMVKACRDSFSKL
jgi:dihydroxyacetone kinase-like protein